MTEETTIIKPEDLYPTETFREMVDAGVFYGRKKNRTNPKMKSAILTNRGGIEIVNLAKTSEQLEKAMAFLTEKIRVGAKPLFVATQPAAADVVKGVMEMGYPVVARRWLGGTLTNFRVIQKRIEYFKKMKSDWENKGFDKYTKKERFAIEKELEKLSDTMTGLEPMIDRPDFLVVIDPNLHLTAVKEARVLRLPVLAFANTDSDPALLDYPVIGNNKARVSISWFMTKLKAAIEAGKAQVGTQPAPKAETPAAEEEKGGKE